MNRLRSTALGNLNEWGIVFFGLSLAALGGRLVSEQLLLVFPLVLLAALLILNAFGTNTPGLFMGALALLLTGFLFLSKAFSYVGAPPIYISEVVLVLGIAALVFGHVQWRFTSLHLLLFAFMGLGLLQTVPHISEYGIYSLRDAAQWYYGLFAVLTSLFLTRDRIFRFLRIYAGILPLLTIWFLVLPVVVPLFPGTLPRFPGSPVPILYEFKPTDRAVILAGLGVFILTGLFRRFSRQTAMPRWVFWAIWLGAAGVVAAESRGGMLAIGAAFVFVALLSFSREWLSPLLVGLVLFSMLVVINPTVELRNRKLSVEQLWTNAVSIVSDETENVGGVQGTREWRLKWWSDIYHDTVHGPYFWTGQGFGINLATEYGFQVDAEESLRSPHNGHITILARMGVPGMLSWAVLLVAFSWQMLRSYTAARRRSQVWAGVIIWLLAMWIAALVNAAFDVYLESPYGAIPFFSIMGAGIAVMRFQREDEISLHEVGSPTHAS